MKPQSFGEIIRDLRKSKGLTLNAVADVLGIDQAILSKIERGKRKAQRKQVIQLASYFKTNEDDLLVAWISDNLASELYNEHLASEALIVAEKKIEYYTTKSKTLKSLTEAIRETLSIDGRVSAAWIFGSTATAHETPNSDADLMIEFNANKKYSMFDLLDLAHKIGAVIKRKIDIVEKGQLKEFALKTANKNMIKVYG
jgi:predicted nucleotidyltransferase/DNA-binding XRE family transcriptional regulator